jgi:hypothetical protein
MATPRKRNYQGQKLPDHVAEGIRQMYSMEPNKALVARTFGVNLSTVYKVLGKEDPEVLREKRREAMSKIASKMTDRVVELVDDLAPPPDASYMQKATATGILTDKVAVLDKRLMEHEQNDKVESGEINALPENIEALVGIVRNDLKSLTMVLGVKFGSELLEKVKEVEDSLGTKLVESPEITKLSDFDNPGEFDEQP